jgi:hypothetical protein
MTCENCLSALATASLREMTPDSAVMQHCATCPDCARLTTTLREKEYEAATVLNTLPPMSNPLEVAETAVRVAQRRRMGRVAVMATGAALVATIWIVSATMLIPLFEDGHASTSSTLRTETIALSCLTATQAADIINPYVRSRGSTYYLPSTGIAAITVRGTADELAKSKDLIAHFERDPSAACHVTQGSLLKPGSTSLLTPQGQSDAKVLTTPNPMPPAPKKK